MNPEDQANEKSTFIQLQSMFIDKLEDLANNSKENEDEIRNIRENLIRDLSSLREKVDQSRKDIDNLLKIVRDGEAGKDSLLSKVQSLDERVKIQEKVANEEIVENKTKDYNRTQVKILISIAVIGWIVSITLSLLSLYINTHQSSQTSSIYQQRR